MSNTATSPLPSQIKPQRKRPSIGNIIVFLILVVCTVAMISPILFMISTALKTKSEMLLFPPTWIPEKLQWNNFVELFRNEDIKFGILYKNSLIIAFFTVIGTVFSSAFVAYGFARFRGVGRNLMFMLMISTMMLPYPAIMIPQFLLFSKLNWMDTFLPLIVPAFFGSAYSIFLLRQFFNTLPNELYDSGKIDGCSELGMFWRIALPLSMPALATVAIFSFIWSWNDLLAPVLYLSSQEKFTLPIGMAALISSKFRISPWNLLMCAAILAVLPVVLLFAVAQKKFTEGIVLTGIK